LRLNYAQPQKTKPKPLMSIKEFSEMSSVEQSTLRYWDEIGLFCPAQRGDCNSYRYYSPDQLITINFIKVLSSLNIPLKVILEISKNRTPENILHLMEQQERILDAELNRLHRAYSTIHTLREHIKPGLNLPDINHISVQALEAMPITLGPPNQPWEGESFYEAFASYCRYAKKNWVNLNTPIGGYYESLDYFLQFPSVPTCFFSVDPLGQEQRPAGDYLVGYTRGYYGQMGDAPQRLADFAARQKLKATGPVYVTYLRDEISTQEPSEYFAQISVEI